MTQIEALDRLIEAVGAGSIHRSDLDAFIPALGLDTESNNALDAYRGSLDAALALHDALLPGHIVGHMCQLMDVDETGQYTGSSSDWMVNLREIPSMIEHDSAIAETPARAWLLAILRAYRSQVTP